MSALGPENLNLTSSSSDPTYVSPESTVAGTFGDVTAALTGTLLVLATISYYLITSVTEKPLVLSNGLVTDLTMGVLRSHGYDVRAVNAADYQGFLSPYQECTIETAVSKRAICLVNDLEKVESFLDGDLTIGDRFTFDGTTYSTVAGCISCQDFRFQTRVRRNKDGNVIYDPTTVCLPGLVSTAPVTTSSASASTVGKFI